MFDDSLTVYYYDEYFHPHQWSFSLSTKYVKRYQICQHTYERMPQLHLWLSVMITDIFTVEGKNNKDDGKELLTTIE